MSTGRQELSFEAVVVVFRLLVLLLCCAVQKKRRCERWLGFVVWCLSL